MAARLLELWGERLGIGIANAINIFDPEEVVVGGGAARAGDLLLEPAKRTADIGGANFDGAVVGGGTGAHGGLSPGRRASPFVPWSCGLPRLACPFF